MATSRLRRSGFDRFRASDRVNLLALSIGAVAGLFILTGTVVAVVLLPVLAAVGTDGVLRAHPAGRLRGRWESLQQAALPAAFAVAAALFFRYVATGYWGLFASVLTGVAFGVVVYAQYATLDIDNAAADAARVVQLAAAHAGVFMLLALFYAYDLRPLPAAVLAGVVAAIFAPEVLRDAEARLGERVTYALAAGLFLAQLRWGLEYVRLDGLLAALLLTLAFYGGLGLLAAGLTRRLDRRTWAEYGLVLLVGMAIVAGGAAISRG